MAKKSTTKTKKTTKKTTKNTTKITYKKTGKGNIVTKKNKTTSGYTQATLQTMICEVTIGGKFLNLDRRECIEKISIVETVDGSDSCTMQIADPKMLFINDDIFLENKSVLVKMYWHGHSKKVAKFEGYISAIDIDFSSDGIPRLTVVCMDNTYRMHKEKKTNTFKNTTSAKVVESICKNYGYKCVIQSNYSFTVQETISQSDQTDIEFIVSLANSETYPFTACLVGKTFYYVKMGALSANPLHTLTYRSFPNDIISFRPQINTESVEVMSGSTDTGTKKSNVSKAKTDGTSVTGDTNPNVKKEQSKSNNKKVKMNRETGDWK